MRSDRLEAPQVWSLKSRAGYPSISTDKIDVTTGDATRKALVLFRIYIFVPGILGSKKVIFYKLRMEYLIVSQSFTRYVCAD